MPKRKKVSGEEASVARLLTVVVIAMAISNFCSHHVKKKEFADLEIILSR